MRSIFNNGFSEPSHRDIPSRPEPVSKDPNAHQQPSWFDPLVEVDRTKKVVPSQVDESTDQEFAQLLVEQGIANSIEEVLDLIALFDPRSRGNLPYIA